MPEIRVVTELQRPAARELYLYRIRKPDADREAVQRVARQVGLKGETGTFCENSSTHAYTEADWSLTLFRESGGWKFRHRHRWQRDDGQADLRIEDAEAIEAARAVVEQHDLAPGEDFVPLRVARLQVATSERNSTKSDERVIDVGVAFQRTIGGVPVEGPGGKVIVYLDHSRELTGIDRLWREIEGKHEAVKELRDPEEAVEQVRRRHEGAGGGRVEVTEMRFGYFEMGWPHAQEILQPAYVVILRLVSEDERVRMPSVLVVAAAQNHVGEIEPTPPQLAAQARREELQT
jgi:hypothetical protein